MKVKTTLKVLKMKTYIILLIFTIPLFFSCNKIDKKELEVIEGIRLGTTFQDYQSQLDSLNIEMESFYTQSIFFEAERLQSDEIREYVSDIFNLSQYGDSETKHYAILVPATLTGTDNVIGLNVIIGHTRNALLFQNDSYDITSGNGISSFNQNISGSLLKKIKEMFISKYGNPVLKGSGSKYNEFYVIEGKDFKKYKGDNNWNGKITEWETDHLQIKLFEGLPSVDAKYSRNGYEIVVQPSGKEDEIISEFNSKNGEEQCFTYAYIKYDLKTPTVQKLHLNEKQL